MAIAAAKGRLIAVIGDEVSILSSLLTKDFLYLLRISQTML